MNRKERLDQLRNRVTTRANNKIAKSKKRFTLGDIFNMYNKRAEACEQPVPLSKKRIAFYCKNLRVQLKEREEVQKYINFVFDEWEDLQETRFSKVTDPIPPLAFISSSSVIQSILNIMNGKTKRVSKVSDRGNYEGREGEWIETPEELRIYEEAKANGILIETRKAYEEHTK